MSRDSEKEVKNFDENIDINTDDSMTIASISGEIKSTEALEPEVEEQLATIAGDINLVEAKDVNNQEILPDEVIKDKLEEVAVKTAPSKKNKTIITSLILLAVNLVLVYLLASNLFKSADDASISNLIAVQGSRLNYLWGAVVCFIFVMLADTLFISLILKMTTKKFRFGLAYKSSAIGKYYEAITPFSAGGQPAQIVYLSKRKVSPGIATSVPIIRAVLINFATIVVAIFLFVFRVPNIAGGNGFMDILIGILEILAYIGLFINSLYFLVVFIIANSKVLGRSLARMMVKVGYKFRIFKDYRSAYKKIISQVTEYRGSVDYLKRNIPALLLSIVLVVIEILSLATIPFFVSLSLTDITFLTTSDMFAFWFECLIKYYICFFASAYIPLPGGTGMMEISFVILFSSIIGPNFVAWGFLIWRFASYYSNIIQGFIITLGDVFAGVFKRKGVEGKIEVKQ